MKKRKHQIVWMVKSPRGVFLPTNTIADTRHEAIRSAMIFYGSPECAKWSEFKARGWSVVLVELREVRAAK